MDKLHPKPLTPMMRCPAVLKLKGNQHSK